MARGEGRKTRQTGTFGTVQKLPSGRFRALYYGPDGDGKRYKAPTTFLTKQDARGWLAMQQADIIRKVWQPPQAPDRKRVTCREYAEQWLKHRPLKTRTREHYRRLLDKNILPMLGEQLLGSITADDIRDWHAVTLTDRPTMRSHAYGLVRAILGSAASEGKIGANPCHIRGAGSAKRVVKIRPATLPELETITAAMPERYRAMVLLAAWCALRFGELTELRRSDIRLESKQKKRKTVWSGEIRLYRGVVRTDDGFEVTTPKSQAGSRDVAIPPHLCPIVAAHLDDHVGTEPDALLFPAVHGQPLAPATFYRWWYPAREAAGRGDLRFHDLRHTSATLAAATGATLAELMNRLGHSTSAAALRYQHVAKGRDAEIAALLSKIATK
ncbi:tyrosine-type recombinase/integrase [Nocardia sp. BSTN01]|uniref:tyrosine-type recombinase/integrase n=1 Tax=Nocardia sp. BSTN01 TaxID=2783665 RepID=UPI001890670D|nr:tyrosine-type recombinase/integrase [Nocardia sp. BSTN01]MBF4998639.1 tyrosine-type recombinase/integrase [Nocardia sp. BSTN01]